MTGTDISYHPRFRQEGPRCLRRPALPPQPRRSQLGAASARRGGRTADAGQEPVFRACDGAIVPRPARRRGGRPHFRAFRPSRARPAGRTGHGPRHRQLGPARRRGRGRDPRPDRAGRRMAARTGHDPGARADQHVDLGRAGPAGRRPRPSAGGDDGPRPGRITKAGSKARAATRRPRASRPTISA